MRKKNDRNNDVLVYALAKLIPALLGFINIFLISRSLSPEKYGEYALIITAVLISSQFFGAWITQATFYFFPKFSYSDEIIKAFGQMTFYVAILGGLMIFAALNIIGVNFKISVAGTFAFFFQIYWNYLCSYYQSLEQPKIQLVATIFQVGVQILIIGFLFFVKNLSIFSAISSVAIGFFSGVYLFYKKSKLSELNIFEIKYFSKFDIWRYVKLVFGYGGPLCMWFLFSQIYTFSDRFLLRWVGLNADLGRYSAARDLLLGIISMIAMPLLMVAHPKIMRIWSDRKSTIEIAVIIRRNLTSIYIIGMFFLLVLYDYGDIFFLIIFSKKYQLDNFQYMIVGATILISVGSMYAHKSFEVTGATLKMAVLAGFVALLNVTCNIFFIKKHGLSGILLVGLMSQIVYFIVASWYSTKLWKITIPIKRVIQVAAIGAAIHLINSMFFLNVEPMLILSVQVHSGLLMELIISGIAILAFPEINELFWHKNLMNFIK